VKHLSRSTCRESPAARPRWRIGARLRVRGRRWRVVGTTAGDDCTALHLREIGSDDSRHEQTILTPFDRPIAVEHQIGVGVVRPRRWLHELDRFVGNLHPFGSLGAIARSSIRLLPHQLEPALSILRGHATRVLIADAVGLGKTIQAGIVLRELAGRTETFRSLVLVPAGLREQWSTELASHFGLVTVQADAKWLRSGEVNRPSHINPWTLPGIYISSHDFVKRPESLRPLEDVVWDLVVIDEAHAATSATDRRAALHAAASRASRVLLLTATPHTGDPAEFGALCRIGRVREDEGPVLLFARSRTDVGMTMPRRTTVLKVVSSEAELRMHRLLDAYSAEMWNEATRRNDEGARLASIILRKRALSSAGSLATSVQRRLELIGRGPEPVPAQLSLPLADEDPLADAEPLTALGAPGLGDVRREKRWLGAIAEAARYAARAETKTRRLLRLLRRIGEPVIVFTEYRDTLTRLRQHIAASGRTVAVLHGGLSAPERSRVPALLANTSTLLATDAAAEGLNLHRHCRIVVHYELPWNPMRLEQRTGRVDRIGQSRRVHEIALVASTTAERLVIEPLTVRASHGTVSGDMLQMLQAVTESRVAEAVMAGSLPVDRRPVPKADTADAYSNALRLEAEEECARLTGLRALIERSDRAGNRIGTDRPVATTVIRKGMNNTCRSRPTDALIAVYAIALEDEDGRQVHAETVTVGIASNRMPSRCTAADVRALAADYVRPTSGELAALLDRRSAKALERTSAQVDRARSRLRQRLLAIAAERRSEAQELVQAQLFGRRRRERPAARSPMAEAPRTERSRLTVNTTLLSLIVVSSR
jgi:superfamily II DNA or RNA helicase